MSVTNIPNNNLTYETSGVNITAGAEAVNEIKDAVKKTYNENILSDLGAFGSAFSLKKIIQNYDDPVLVQSTDGVGTKLIIAKIMNKFEGIGQDVVANNVNDMLCMGAKPITFLDYVGCSHLDPSQMKIVVEGMAQECFDNNIALVGGEMAEMPGVYVDGEIDVVGFVTGIVEKSKIINSKDIAEGDSIIGITSSGPHTNGFSLARKIVELAKIDYFTTYNELNGKSIGEALLTPHRNYTSLIHSVLDKSYKIKGLSHITGGGFVENIPRIIPDELDASIDTNSYDKVPIFELLQSIASKAGYNIENTEMYRTFNMGIGMVLVCDSQDTELILEVLNIETKNAFLIGKVVKGDGKSKTVLEF